MKYSKYIFKDQLISPITGYSCKRITKQNIFKFGFDSIDELIKSMPEFPLICKEYHDKVKLNSIKGILKGSKILKQNNDKNKANQKEIYRVNPKLCKKCNNSIMFEKRNNSFCSRSCANSHIISIEHKEKTSISLTKKEKISRVFFPNCNKCNKIFATRYQRQKFCSHVCQKNVIGLFKNCKICFNLISNKKLYCESCYSNIRHYRTKCSFKFNVFDYPNEFDLHLVKKYGWFSPNGYKRKNNFVNLDGVSKDHLYTVAEGYANKIDPLILSHPANCRIIKHNGPGGNNSKRKSSITINELLIKIDIWERKYREK